jgi:hypothetical protein
MLCRCGLRARTSLSKSSRLANDLAEDETDQPGPNLANSLDLSFPHGSSSWWTASFEGWNREPRESPGFEQKQLENRVVGASGVARSVFNSRPFRGGWLDVCELPRRGSSPWDRSDRSRKPTVPESSNSTARLGRYPIGGTLRIFFALLGKESSFSAATKSIKCNDFNYLRCSWKMACELLLTGRSRC